jgi:Domain of unknown function (DUF4189)
MESRSTGGRLVRASAVLLACCAVLAVGAASAAGPRQAPSWGAIAAMNGTYGYSFNQPSRTAAETAARAQCDRAAGRSGTCVVSAYFDRSCGALATGNYGEWGAATAATADAAAKAATTQCDNHLPAEPCKLVVKVCSPR